MFNQVYYLRIRGRVVVEEAYEFYQEGRRVGERRRSFQECQDVRRFRLDVDGRECHCKDMRGGDHKFTEWMIPVRVQQVLCVCVCLCVSA